ncbi:hypothetical protein F4774DRAFT_412659 [Daldinia eschscholtzii]|nr:hypothetical protein F4774DRAFT_412659 [Daldinia eschscholtzii]
MERPNTKSHLLKLPIEIIVNISSYLPQVDQAVFAMICRALRLALGKPDVRKLSTGQYLRFLIRVARDLPDQWVCEACFKLHPVSLDDTPITPWKMSCPLPWDQWCNEVYGRQSRLDNRFLLVDHRHIQLALKYTRLRDSRYQSYHEKLLTEHQDVNFSTFSFPSKRDNLLDVSYTVTPKIMKGPDGNFRYLLRSCWQYRKASMEVSLITMGDIKLCPHTSISYDLNRSPINQATHIMLARYSLSSNFMDTFSAGCPCCATDIAIKFSKELVVVCTWQDMGTKGSPGDIAWRSHVSDPRFIVSNFQMGRPDMFKLIGSVRELYHDTQIFNDTFR